MKTVATGTSCLLVIKPNAACCRGARLSGCVFYCTTKPARRPHLPRVSLSHRVQSTEGEVFCRRCSCREISERAIVSRLTSVSSWPRLSSRLPWFQAELRPKEMQRRFAPEFRFSMLQRVSAPNNIFFFQKHVLYTEVCDTFHFALTDVADVPCV